MSDLTNITDFDPTTGHTTTTLVSTHDRGAQDWATAEGESHDTWHRPGEGGEPAPDLPSEATGNFTWNAIRTSGTLKRTGAISGPWSDLPTNGTVVELSVNGTNIGRYERSVNYGPGLWTPYVGEMELHGTNLDGVDNSAFLAPLTGTTVTIDWPDPVARFPITIDPTEVTAGTGVVTITITSPGEMEEGITAFVATPFISFPCTLVSPDVVTFGLDTSMFAPYIGQPVMLRKADGTSSTPAAITFLEPA
jgi:hypothetical protein